MNGAIKTYVDFLRCRIKNVKVLVVGDIMLDRYFFGTASRISPEAPVPVNLVKRKKDTLGGAANVAHNLAKLNCKTYLIGMMCDDHHGHLLEREMENEQINAKGIVLGSKPTTTKVRILGGHQQMIRVDFEESAPIDQADEKKLQDSVNEILSHDIQAVIISDYGKGICTKELCHFIIQNAKASGIPVFVDPKGNKWEKYAGASYITPNVKEASEALSRFIDNDKEKDIKEAAEAIQINYNIENVMITRSERGLSLFTKKNSFTIPTISQEVFDVSGAGDTVISVFASAIGGGLEAEAAAELANFAAGIEVGKLGTYAVSNSEIIAKLAEIAE